MFRNIGSFDGFFGPRCRGMAAVGNGALDGRTVWKNAMIRAIRHDKQPIYGVLMNPGADHIVSSKNGRNRLKLEIFPPMVYGNGRTGPTKVEKRRLAGGGSCVLTNAHFAELDTLMSQHLGLRRIGDGRRLRVFQDLAAHGLVVLNGPVDKGAAPDRAVTEAAATQRGRTELRKWRSLVTRPKAGLPIATFNDGANGP